MLNRKLVAGALLVMNILLTTMVLVKFGAASLNNWLMIGSGMLLSLAIYRVLGMVEGYRN